MYNILVCDDDKEIVEAIEIYLSQEGLPDPEGLRRAGGDGDPGEGGCQPAPHRCDDAEAGRDPGDAEDPGEEQHPDHHPVGEVRGRGQDPGAQRGRGRLCDEAVQPAGTGGQGPVPAAALQSAGRFGTGFAQQRRDL